MASSMFQNNFKQLWVLVMSSGVENIKRSFEEKGKWSLEQFMFLVVQGAQEEGGKRQTSGGRGAHPEPLRWGEGCLKKIHRII